jgi:hypothetical protein
MANESNFGGPYVTAALLCEKVLVERDNVATFVRVVDRFAVPKFAGPIPPGVQLPQQTIQATLVILLKSGDLGAGSHKVGIRLQKPDLTYAPENSLAMFFQGGDDNGAIIAMPIMLAAPEEGLYWFDVLFEGSLLTRVPLRVLHQPAILQVQMQPPPEDH